MTLTDPWFEAEFYGECFEDQPCTDGDDCIIVEPRPHTHSGWRRQSTAIDGAQGLFMYCPCRYGTDQGHGLMVPFANPRNAPPCPPKHGPVSRDGSHHPRWTMQGVGLSDLTLTPSILVGIPGKSECWHGFITGGAVI